MSTFFYDSYAVIEYLNGNERYRPYFEEHSGILTQFNVVEVAYALLRQGRRDIHKTVGVFDRFVVVPDLATLIAAAQFRLGHKGISFADAVGYVVAGFNGAPFLTGDRLFKDLPNVEFVTAVPAPASDRDQRSP